MSLTAYERECTITYNDADDYAVVYSCHRPTLTILQKMSKKFPEDYKLVKEDEESQTYHVKKWLVSFRSPREKRELTEEQRQELKERGQRLAESRKKSREEGGNG